MHYFLADDTIEIRAVHGPNSGRDPIPVMVKRGKIPKSIVGGSASEAYHWRDFDIGVEVRYYTRNLLVHGTGLGIKLDTSTKDFHSYPQRQLVPFERGHCEQ